MKKLFTKTAFALLALVLPQFAVSVSACSCFAIPTPYGAFRKGWAILAAKESLAEEEKGFDWGSADEQGRFSLQGFVGAEY